MPTRLYADNAARQRAYRQRLQTRTSTPPRQFRAPFTVVGDDGQPLLSVRESQQGPVLHLFDAQGKVAVQISSDPREGGGIGIVDARGRGRWV